MGLQSYAVKCCFSTYDPSLNKATCGLSVMSLAVDNLLQSRVRTGIYAAVLILRITEFCICRAIMILLT